MAVDVNSEPDVSVREDTERSRFEVLVDGHVVGYAEYRPDGSALAMAHTVVDPAYEGMGLASRLIGDALAALRERGDEVLPYCSFVHAYLERHEELRSIVPADQRERFGLA